MSEEPPANSPTLLATIAALSAGIVLALRSAIDGLAKRRSGKSADDSPRSVAIEPKNALSFWELQTAGFREVHEIREELAWLSREVRKVKAEIRRLRERLGRST